MMRTRRLAERSTLHRCVYGTSLPPEYMLHTLSSIKEDSDQLEEQHNQAKRGVHMKNPQMENSLEKLKRFAKKFDISLANHVRKKSKQSKNEPNGTKRWSKREPWPKNTDYSTRINE